MTTLPIVDLSGASVGEFAVCADWIEREKGEQAVRDTVVAYLAGLRAGTACTKTRSKVRGGGAKPYRQKGTGRGRAGSIRSPLWRGGGTIFGPVPRAYTKKVNKKVRRLALRRCFTERLDEGALIVVDSLGFEQPKTRLAAAALKAIGAGDDVLVVMNGFLEHGNACMALRNLPKVSMVEARSVNAYDMLLHKKVVISQDALDVLGGRISRAAVAAMADPGEPVAVAAPVAEVASVGEPVAVSEPVDVAAAAAAIDEAKEESA